jgi:osmoprotectant transport system substrate-binding protein
MRKLLLAAVLMAVTPFLLVASGGREEGGASSAEEPSATSSPGTGVPFSEPINIGTKNFTEQYVVGNLMSILLEERGYDVELKTGMSSTVLREAMENGDLDLCMDYTGTQWLTYTGHEFGGESPAEIYQLTKESDAEAGLVWLDPIWCNNTYAIAVTEDFSQEHGVETLSDFAGYVNEMEGEVDFASDFEFYSRPDGILGLQVHYGFAFKPANVTTVLPGLTFEYLEQGRSTAAMVFGTDPVTVKFGWVVLQDDKNFWPPYDLAPYLRKEVVDAKPEVVDVLEELVQAFPQDPAAARAEMTALNAKVDIDMMEPEDAARAWLEDKGLIGG